MKPVTALRLSTSFLLCGAALVVSAAASAQEAAVDVDRNSTVMNRPRPDYDPLGIRVRSFFIYPSLSVGGTYDSNINATPNNTESDFGLLVSPQINVVSNWTRHALGLSLSAVDANWADHSRNNYLDLNGVATGRLDITRVDALTGTFTLARTHEARSSPDAAQSETRTLTEVFTGSGALSYRHDFNRIFTVVGAEAQRTGYENSDVSQTYRNRWTYTGDLRVGYQVSPRLATFIELAYQVIRYDTTTGGVINRDAQGFKVDVGTQIDITGLLFGELQIGYNQQTYEDNSLDAVRGISSSGSLTWNPTQLDTVVFSPSATIIPTTITFEGDTASADFQKSVNLSWTHELLRNVLLNANAGYVRDDFEGTSRSDDTFLAGGGATYLINRNFSLDATYNFTKRTSNDNDQEYTGNVILVGLTAKL